MPEADLEACREAIRTGSYSFHAASRLLPSRYRDPALALYAFCRLADDSVDLQEEKTAAVLRLGERLDAAYAGRPENAPEDRAFTAMVEGCGLPRALPEALLEGLAWDAMERRYHTLSDVRAYAARVASTVGAMMAVIMGVRDPNALARACDLGVAMQLTNIARDVGEDARAHRIYLPLDWLDEAGIAPVNFLRDPVPSDLVRDMVRRLLAEARRLYARGEAGIATLPVSCRPGIFAARHIYDGIGAEIARAGHDSISTRAHTSAGQKVGWLVLSGARALGTAVSPHSAVLYARPLEETAFLVDAAAPRAPPLGPWGEGRAGELVSLFAELKRRDAERRASQRSGPRVAAE
ncbi:MAG: phytoene/squalene synthase family protein [Pseudomonadota bacterium]